MHESKRTLIFVGTAVATVALAVGTHWAMRPVSLEQFSDVGEAFYPDFDDPNAATGLRVAAYNEDAARVDVFNVEFNDGLWRIPSHHNYPADGEDRLAKTATSIIGITRDAIVSTSADDFKRLGVLDPLDESVTGTEGRGDRITLLEGDNTLADYIIGTNVEGQGNTYHVRKPGENRTYRATLELDISTKFADWIEPGLLDFRRGDLREIVIDRYSIDEARGVIVPGEISRLTRESSTASWELDDLQAGEELKTTSVDPIINALEDLTIVGVRPKPPALIAALKGEGDGTIDAFTYQAIIDKGYFLKDGKFLSNEGEVHVGTAEGVSYVLQFGEVFTGTDVEIEVGRETGDEAQPDDDATDEAAEDTPDEQAGESSDDAEGGESTKQNRYLFITTVFDESLIEPPGEKPVQPEPPADDPAAKPDLQKDAENDQPADNAREDDEAQANDEANEESPADEQTGDDADVQEEATEDETTEEADYEQALADYETALEAWERDQTAYEEKLEKGRERVAELNVRFANWYYVISADSFDEIRVSREALVEAKEPDEDAEQDTDEDAEQEPGEDAEADSDTAPAAPVIEAPPNADSEAPPDGDGEADSEAPPASPPPASPPPASPPPADEETQPASDPESESESAPPAPDAPSDDSSQ